MDYVTFTQIMLNFSVLVAACYGLAAAVGQQDAQRVFDTIWQTRIDNAWHIGTVFNYQVRLGLIDFVIALIILYGLAFMQTSWCWAWTGIDLFMMGLPFSVKQLRLLKPALVHWENEHE